MQLQLNLDIHKRESNPVSQSFLDEHREDFTADAWGMLLELMKGTHLTNKRVIEMGLSNSPTRRWCDIEGWGITISRKKIQVGYSNRRVFEYWMEPSEISRVANMILHRMIVVKKEKKAA